MLRGAASCEIVRTYGSDIEALCGKERNCEKTVFYCFAEGGSETGKMSDSLAF